jgi:hypothetical protein
MTCEYCKGPNSRLRSKYCSRQCDKKAKSQVYKSIGLCTRCGNPNDTNLIVCSKCQEKSKEIYNRTSDQINKKLSIKREEAKKNGLCSMCCIRTPLPEKLVCEDCKERSKGYFYNNPQKDRLILLKNAKARAKRYGVPFTITLDDIDIPKRCPILEIQIHPSNDGKVKPQSPSIDRIVPELGYVPGNIRVVSHRANTLKSNMDVETLKKIINYIENSK